MSEAVQTSAPRGGRFAALAAGVLMVAAAAGWLFGTFRTPSPEPIPVAEAGEPTPSVQRGELLFQMHCASCHGPEGRGDGPSAASMHPPPRDFAVRPWRGPVSVEAIRTAILRGIPGTAMASFQAAIAPADVEPLAQHVLLLAASRPVVPYEPTEEERLLKDAGLIDLRGSEPPALTVTDAAGKSVELGDLKGRLVLLHFWGTACVSCLKEMPQLRELERDYAGRGLTVLHICTDAEDVRDGQKLAERVALGVRVYAEETGLGLARFDVQTLPAVWLIAPDGRAIARGNGARNWNDPALRRIIESRLPPR